MPPAAAPQRQVRPCLLCFAFVLWTWRSRAALKARRSVCLSVLQRTHTRAYTHTYMHIHAHMEIPFLGEALAVCHRAPSESREVRARGRFQAPIFNPDPSLCQGCNLPAVVCSPWSHSSVIDRPPKEDIAVHHISYL